MYFSKEQVINIAKYFKNKYFQGEIEPHELAVAIITMVVAEKITEMDAAFIFSEVFLGNMQAARRALKKAEGILSDELVQEIIETIEKKLQK